MLIAKYFLLIGKNILFIYCIMARSLAQAGGRRRRRSGSKSRRGKKCKTCKPMKSRRRRSGKRRSGKRRSGKRRSGKRRKTSKFLGLF
mgnify:CR=1 FL=1